MRLRTFDGGGDTPEGASPPISKINVVRLAAAPLALQLRTLYHNLQHLDADIFKQLDLPNLATTY